jgi:hypothetical protein
MASFSESLPGRSKLLTLGVVNAGSLTTYILPAPTRSIAITSTDTDVPPHNGALSLTGLEDFGVLALVSLISFLCVHLEEVGRGSECSCCWI